MAVKGLADLKRRLARMPEAAKEAALKSVLEGAHELAAMQKSLVPVRKGKLRDSIAVTPPGGTTPPYSQPGGSRTAGPLEAIVTAGNTEVRYAHLVEFGTAPHIAGGIFEGAQHPGSPAEPFFWPSYRALKPRIRRRISSRISRAIKKEFKS